MPQEGYTPKEIADLEKSRTISDAEFLRGGAEYDIHPEGEKVLRVTDSQVEEAQEEMYKEFSSGSIEQQREAYIQKLIKGGARYVENERGEKHLVLTEEQIQRHHDSMEDYLINNLTPELKREIKDFILAPGELEKVKVYQLGQPWCCDPSFYLSDVRKAHDVEKLRRVVGAEDGETFISKGCGDWAQLIYKGRYPFPEVYFGYGLDSEEYISLLRDDVNKFGIE